MFAAWVSRWNGAFECPKIPWGNILHFFTTLAGSCVDLSSLDHADKPQVGTHRAPGSGTIALRYRNRTMSENVQRVEFELPYDSARDGHEAEFAGLFTGQVVAGRTI